MPKTQLHRLQAVQLLADEIDEYINSRPGTLFKARHILKEFRSSEGEVYSALRYLRMDGKIYFTNDGKLFYYWSKRGETRTNTGS